MRFSLMFVLCSLVSALAGCGGGGGGSDSSSVAAQWSSAPNVLAVTVELGPSRNVNIPYTTVTVCAPGSEVDCKTIDHILVDTGSNGLRLFASALSSAPALSLPQQTSSGGTALAECMQFADFTAIWGPVKLADVKLAGLRANSVPVHVVGDSSFAGIPAGCSNSFTPADTSTAFGANGVLGVGYLAEDCGTLCAGTTNNGFYYACPPSGCTPTAASLVQQVPNPVARFATDNNGAVLKMPPVAAGGAATATGSLIFGIGTQPNNALGAAKVFTLSSTSGISWYLSSIYKTRPYSKTFIDSGSNALYFDDSDMTICSGYDHGFYCPSSPQNLSATITGINGTSDTIAFSVSNADQLFSANSSYVAFGSLAGPVSATSNSTLPANSWSPYFDWGLPFFYGRSVFTAIRDRDTPAGKGPYYAY